MAFSQSFGQQYSLRQYTLADGLPQSQVSALLEDQNGYLWAGTQGGGLARFDGNEFKVYNTFDGLLSNTILGIILDSKNQLWVLHQRGVSKFNGTRFEKLELTNDNTGIQFIFEHCDTLFVLTQGGKLGSIINNRINTELKWPTRSEIRFISTIDQNQVVFFTADQTAIIKNGAKTSQISYEDQFSFVRSSFTYLNSVVLNTDKGYFELDLTALTIRRSPISSKNNIIFYDSAANVVWTLPSMALIKEPAYGNGVQVDTVLNGITVNQVMKGREGNIWIATNGKGVYKYFPKDFSRRGPASLQSVMAIMQDQSENVWIGTIDNGLWRMKDGALNYYPIGKANLGRAISQIKQAVNGDIWVSSYDGLARFDRTLNKFQVFSQQDGLPSDRVRCFDFDLEGGIWVGTRNGVAYFKDGKVEKKYLVEDGLNSNRIFSIYYSSKENTVYAGTESGINIIRNGKVGKIEIPDFTNTTILSIQSFRDSLVLMGSNGAGAIIYSPKHGKHKSVNSHSGLPSDLVYFISSDQEGNVWVGTERGINKIKFDANLEIVENINFNQNSGLLGLETNHNAFFLGNKKYFGLLDGFYEYNAVHQDQRLDNKVHFTGVDIFFDDSLARRYSSNFQGFFNIPIHPEFPPEKNHITFHFNKIDHRYPQNVRFQYYLKNFDKSWSQPSTIRQASYSNLPPGQYEFNVRAISNVGSWSEKPLTYSFTILPPVYQKAWFIISAVIMVIAFLMAIIYWRMKWFSQEKRISKMEIDKIGSELNYLRAQINPHFLFNTLNSIYSLSIKKSDRTPEVVMRLSDMMEYMLYESVEVKVPLEKEINNLINYVEMEKLRQGNNARIDFSFLGEYKNECIVPLLLLPLVENGVKHGINMTTLGAFLRVEIELNGQKLKLKVENNILTNKKREDRQGLGIINLRKRLDLFYPQKHILQLKEESDMFIAQLTIDLI